MRNHKWICFLFIPSLSLASPSITNVTGTFFGQATDQIVVTITGVDFSTKSPAAPVVFADFEDGTVNPTSLGIITAWNANDGPLISTTTKQLINSSHSILGTWVSPSTSFSFQLKHISTFSFIYSFGRRYHEADLTGNQKVWRLHRADGGGTWVVSSSGDGVFLNEDCSGNQLNQFQDIQSKIDEGNFYTEEHIWSHGSYTGADWIVANGYWNYLVDGFSVQKSTSGDNCDSQSTEIRVWDNFSNVGVVDGAHLWMDDLYVDSTWSRVFISTVSTWTENGTGGRREIQIPNAWSDTEVQVYFRQGEAQADETWYMFVCDHTNSCNSNGFEITIGESIFETETDSFVGQGESVIKGTTEIR